MQVAKTTGAEVFTSVEDYNKRLFPNSYREQALLEEPGSDNPILGANVVNEAFMRIRSPHNRKKK